VPACKPRALKVGSGYILVDWDACDGCGRCSEACDRGAITLKSAGPGKPAAKGIDPAPKSIASVQATKVPAAGIGVGTGWSMAEGVLALVCALALYVAVQAVPGGFAHAPVWSGLTLLGYDVAVAALLYVLARRRGVGVLAAFRLDVAPEWSSMGLAVAVAAGCWLVSVGYRVAASAVGFQPPQADGPDLVTLFGSGVAGVVITLLVVAVAGPVLEEALLRGTVLQALRSRLGVWPAVAASSVAYALLHASAWSFLPLVVLGAALGWLATRSRSLWPAVTAHLLYNLVLVGAALYKALGA
jgi:membrane protease YdiL (CAAX protease family)